MLALENALIRDDYPQLAPVYDSSHGSEAHVEVLGHLALRHNADTAVAVPDQKFVLHVSACRDPSDLGLIILQTNFGIYLCCCC